MFESLSWVCHICEEERPDHKISVLSKPMNIPGIVAAQNVRYCNDRSECIEGAQTFSFVKEDGE